MKKERPAVKARPVDDGGDIEESLLYEAKERYKECEEAWDDNRNAALSDIRFRAGEQWPLTIRKTREKDNRPCLVVDKLSQFVRQVVNDGRQNRPAVKVRPIDDGGDIEIAEIFQGIIRHICDKSNADAAFDCALESAVVGGFGFFRVLTEYISDGSFNQDIKVKRVRNPMMVMLDPASQEADFSDAKYGFVVDEISKEEFKATYPKSKKMDWDSEKSQYGDWIGEKVRIAEYFYIEEEDSLVHLLEDGTTVSDEMYQRAIKEGVHVPDIKDTRNIPKKRVKWCKLSGAEILEKRDWLGKYIPIVPVIGNEFDIDGKVIYSGMIRAAKDAARLYNYSRSAYAERVALTPKAPWVAAAGQVEEYYDEWANANVNNVSVLRYDPTDVNGTALPPPQRQQASDIPAGFSQDMQISEHDIQSSIGMYSASLGRRGNATSGKQESIQQHQGDISTFHYNDNLNRAIVYLGRILVDLIPRVYDSRRVIRILGEDGSPEQAQINPEQEQAVDRSSGIPIYNLGVGTYDVAITVGPSYNTKRMESADTLMSLAATNPTMWQTHGDIIAKSQDWPSAEEFAERSKLMLPPQVQEAMDNKSQNPEVMAVIRQAKDAIQQRDQAMQQMQQQANDEIQKLNEELQAAKKLDDTVLQKQQEAALKNDIEQKNLELKHIELQIKQYDAETKRMALNKDMSNQ